MSKVFLVGRPCFQSLLRVLVLTLDIGLLGTLDFRKDT